MTHKQFIDYVLSFYGHGGIYAFRPAMKYVEARYALGVLLKADAAGEHAFDGDTFDRELARDIVVLMRDPTAQSFETSKAYHLFEKYAHKRRQSRRPRSRALGGGR